MLQTALRFLDEHKEITLATCEGNLPKLRVFQVMKREGNMLYFDLTPTPPVFKHFDLMTGEVSNGFVGERFKNK